MHLQKENFIGKKALAKQAKSGFARKLVGLEIDWTEVEKLYDKVGLAPQALPTARRALGFPIALATSA